MRKVLAVTLIGSLILALLPTMALAGDSHAVRNRWLGAAIGAGSVVLGGILFNAIRGNGPAAVAPVAYPAPQVVAPPPAVYYPAPPVVYAPPPVVEYRTWVPSHYEDRWVPATERQRVWVEGHHENGWWVPAHWEERVRGGGYWTRVWVDGYWR
ncbi:MAG: hypothetical protein HY766_13330 [candidate division NC10 bacterium]|nr:hypothetical protein [candidate division NC10 bacterium]